MPPDPIDLAAIVPADERDTIVAAARRLSDCLGDASAGHPVRVRFATHDAPPPGPSAALILSLRAEGGIGPDRVAAARAAGHATLLIPTLFRHVGAARIESIRRLNLHAIGLSRSLGVQIVDLDRIFALVGARTLAQAPRLAQELAAHALVGAILAAGLDTFAVAERQEQARLRNGGREAIVARHLREDA